jgi:hypothetical protein
MIPLRFDKTLGTRAGLAGRRRFFTGVLHRGSPQGVLHKGFSTGVLHRGSPQGFSTRGSPRGSSRQVLHGRFFTAGSTQPVLCGRFYAAGSRTARPSARTRGSRRLYCFGVVTQDLDRRLWRVRRRHDSIEAYLQQSDAGWSLQFLRNGRIIVTRNFETRDEGVRAAEARLREFERVGWNRHW